MKFGVGDLVKYDGQYIDELPWLVVGITKTKKTWARKYLLYRNGNFLIIPYKELYWSVLLSGSES